MTKVMTPDHRAIVTGIPLDGSSNEGTCPKPVPAWCHIDEYGKAHGRKDAPEPATEWEIREVPTLDKHLGGGSLPWWFHKTYIRRAKMRRYMTMDIGANSAREDFAQDLRGGKD